jgi:hypothetical protein
MGEPVLARVATRIECTAGSARMKAELRLHVSWPAVALVDPRQAPEVIPALQRPIRKGAPTIAAIAVCRSADGSLGTASALPGSAWPSPRPLQEGEGE